MPNCRQVVQGISATLPLSFVVETVSPGALTGSPAYAQAASNREALAGHFHPKGKAPSRFTLEVLQQAKATLPFADKRDFEEQKKGFIAPMKDLKIMADAGHVAWDMERFQFLEQQEEFDSIHPSLLRQSVLNNNYGLYEVIPGIYQVRGFDLSDITFVRGKTGWIVIDPLVTAEDGSRGVEAVPGARRRGPARLGRDLFALACRPLGRRARHRRGSGRAVRKDSRHRPRQLHGAHDFRERLRRQRHEPAAVLPVRPAAARQPARLRRPGPRPGRVGRRRWG